MAKLTSRWGWLLLLLVLTSACTTASRSPTSVAASRSSLWRGTAPDGKLDAQTVELRALVLLLADRRTYEGAAVNQALVADPETRRQLAFALGRIGRVEGRAALASLVIDRDLKVRRAAAFGLGLLLATGDRASARPLLRMVIDADRETGVRAIDGLGRAGVALEDVVAKLIELPVEELLPRLLPGLFRFEGPGVVGWAEQGLELADPALRADAAYALSRNPRPAGLPALRNLISDPDPWIAGWAARALGTVGEREDVARLLPLLARPEVGPPVRALVAVRALVDRGVVAAPTSWRPRLLTLFDDPRPGVRLTALEVASAWLLDDALGAALADIAGAATDTGGEAVPSSHARVLALQALSQAEDPRALGLVATFAQSPERGLRAAAANAAGWLGARDLLASLADDESAMVRAAALTAGLRSWPQSAEARALAALLDLDPGVRSIALDWARDHPVIPADILALAMKPERRDRILDAAASGIEALAVRAEVAPQERLEIISYLAQAAIEAAYPLRRAVIAALAALDQNTPPLGEVRTALRGIAAYRDTVYRLAAPQDVLIETTRGAMRVRLACDQAPLTCLNFLQLAGQGFYDGLLFHRVVPDFVIQGGDPRGDGRGGPGYRIRDEGNLLPYGRGVLGMARSGPDTASSQFFITLSRQPHLSGAYTAFGTVVEGDEVLDAIIQGDRIVRITVIDIAGGTGDTGIH